jgi:hypothetical protein
MCTHICAHIYVHTCMCYRGYGRKHGEPETDSDGDGGVLPKLGGRGHIEFSKKGIPHGSLHFPKQLQWAGHIFMHDTCAPEASHKTTIKKAMDRVRKSDDTTTSASMIKWRFWVQTWGKIIAQVKNELQSLTQRRRVRRRPVTETVVRNNTSKLLQPTRDVSHLLTPNTFSPLRAGGDHFMSPDARISYNEVTYDNRVCKYSYMCTHICVLI